MTRFTLVDCVGKTIRDSVLISIEFQVLKTDRITCHYAGPAKQREIHSEFVANQEATKIPRRIPKTLHFIWFGDGQPNSLIAKWEKMHPDYEIKVWNDEIHSELGTHRTLFEKAKTPAEKSLVARYLILYQHGGIYIDCDVECRKVDRTAASFSWLRWM